jgi:hypothetical protein
MLNVYVRVCVWHRNVHSDLVGRRQALNDKKKKTDARKEKGGFFYSHTKRRERERRERKRSEERCEEETGMRSLRNRELPATTTACCQSD